MADEYVPSEDEIREMYVWLSAGDNEGAREQASEDFNRYLARVRRDAAREALGGLATYAAECMDGKHGDLAAEDLSGWHYVWAAAKSRCANHYPEETP